MRDLIPIVQFKKLEKHPRRNDTFSKVAGFKVACNVTESVTPPWVIFTFLNCANSTKLCKASNMD